MYFHCYYCSFETDIDRTYQDHVKQSHPDKPVYPSKKQIKRTWLSRTKQDVGRFYF